MKKRYIAAGGIGAVLLAGLLALNVSTIGRIYLPSGTGITAKQLCSMVFVSGLDTDYAKRVYIDPLLGDAASAISVDVDMAEGEVSASIAGLFWRQRAIHREGLGCTLVRGGSELDEDLAMPAAAPFQPMPLDDAYREVHFDVDALESAIDVAFEDPDGRRNTLAVAVLHQGRLVAERYAAEASQDTRFIGWSMTKSITATSPAYWSRMARSRSTRCRKSSPDRMIATTSRWTICSA